jgi:hypothetical protein
MEKMGTEKVDQNRKLKMPVTVTKHLTLPSVQSVPHLPLVNAVTETFNRVYRLPTLREHTASPPATAPSIRSGNPSLPTTTLSPRSINITNPTATTINHRQSPPHSAISSPTLRMPTAVTRPEGINVRVINSGDRPPSQSVGINIQNVTPHREPPTLPTRMPSSLPSSPSPSPRSPMVTPLLSPSVPTIRSPLQPASASLFNTREQQIGRKDYKFNSQQFEEISRPFTRDILTVGKL